MKAINFNLIFGLILLLVCMDQSAKAQQEETLIMVTGTVIDVEDKTVILAQVFYEKLPFYDDIGIAHTDQNSGVYELHMIENQKYIINVKATGYQPIMEEMEITDTGIGLIEKNFEMTPTGDNQKISLDDLIFARGKSVITESSYKELDEFAGWMEEHPNAVVQLEGHTDFQGNAQANLQLSLDRVEAVKDYLVKLKIKKSRIRTKAFGGTQPLTRERTDEGRTMNRRVEVRIIQQ